MALYLISYDLAEKDKFEYEPLWTALKSMGAVRILYSEWLVPSPSGRAAAIYESIAPLTLMTDRLLILEVLSDARWDKLLVTDEQFQSLMQQARR
jgi:hypothetical protein